ncbi:hypothetical protein [Paenibacillus alkalitolerans]|uniref:hypothetical protein n=1 Tax=Paenibacillus alkalitolerans TaxID=2799335 RepID=UPI0018F4BB37|nr:hypothetical protein [Paenibacillus alkalitolerans]
MGEVRLLQDLTDVVLNEWSDEELRRYDSVLSDVSPWLNSQGVSLHHQVIDERKRRIGGPTFET